MTQVSLLADGKIPTHSIDMGQSLSVAVEFRDALSPFVPVLGVVVRSHRGHALFGVNNRFVGGVAQVQRMLAGQIVCNLGDIPLVPGNYSIDLYLGDEYRDLDVVENAIDFTVEPTDFYGTGKLAPVGAGAIRWSAQWTYSPPNATPATALGPLL